MKSIRNYLEEAGTPDHLIASTLTSLGKDKTDKYNIKDNYMIPPQRNSATIQVVAERINSLHEDVTDLRFTMQESVKEMSHAIQTLVRLEERQLNLNQTAEETKQNFKLLEARVDVLEKEQPMNRQVTKWVMGAVGSIVAVSAMIVAKMLGIY